MEKQIPNSASLDPAVRHALDWVRRYADSLVVAGDHGGLTGLADDDHPQYLNNARGDVRYLTAATAAATYQPLDADLTAIAALVTTAHGRGLLTGADAAATRAALGLGSLATLSSVGSAEITNDSIVDADINAAAGIADTKLGAISTANKVNLNALDIDGGNDIAAALADADLIIVDDGATGLNRKSALSRVATWLFAKVSGDATASSGGALTIANDAVTNAKAANMAADTLKGRANGAGAGDPTDLTVAQVKTVLGGGTQAKMLVAVGTAGCSPALTTTTTAADIAGCTTGTLALTAGDVVEVNGVFDATHPTINIVMVGLLDINGVLQTPQALLKMSVAAGRSTVSQQWLYTVPSTGNYTFKLRGRHNTGATGGTFETLHTTISWKVYR